MRFFSRRHRCITYSFRGYPGSDVPENAAMYGQRHAVDDAKHMLDHLKIAKAHVVGLSQGAFATAHFGRLHADRALSLTLAGVGSGAGREGHEQFKKDAVTTAQRIRQEGMAKYAEGLTTNPTRSRFKQKDPRGFAEFVKHLSEHADDGCRQHDAGVPGQAAVALRLRGRVEEARPADADHLRRRGRALPAAQPLPQARDAQCRPRRVRQERPHGEYRGAGRLQPRSLEFPGAGRGRQVDARPSRWPRTPA